MTLFETDISLHDEEQIRIFMQKDHRFYHTLAHAEYTFRASQEIFKFYLKDTKWSPIMAQRMYRHAAAFHDALYVLTNNGVSERLSADMYVHSETAMFYPAPFVEDIILATWNHFDPKHDSLPIEAQVFLDADLYHLCASFQAYDAHAKNVEMEYRAKYSEEEYIDGRIEWLTKMMERERIYRVCESKIYQAKTNLKRELSDLKRRSNAVSD